MKNIIKYKYLPFAVTTTLLSGLFYIALQQDIRQLANDPQIGIVNEITAELSQNPDMSLLPQTLFQKTDPRVSTSPFVNIYDDGGRPLVDGVNGSSLAPLPAGVLDYIRTHGTDIFTWQPQFDQPQKPLRIAAVVSMYTYQGTSGFVLAGRSLRDVEVRENNLTHMVLVGWLVTMLAAFFAVYVEEKMLKKTT